MKINEFITQEDMNDLEEKASRALCTSTKSNKELGASNLASCKSQGLRAREGKKSHKLGKSSKSRVTVGGHRIKGKKYGGPLPDWSESIEESLNESFVLAEPKGIKGVAVADLQKVLLALGYQLPKHGVDGIRGPETTAAVKQFQTDAGLKVDGIPGPDTVKAINLILKDLPELAKTIVPSTDADVKNKTIKSRNQRKPLSTDSVTQGKIGELLNFIARYESGGNYNIVVGGKVISELTQMTLSQVYDFQRQMRSRGHESTAVGRYQYINKTLRNTAAQMGLDPETTLFDPKTQDAIATETLRSIGLDQWLNGQVEDGIFLNKIARIWAGIPTTSGVSAHQGVGSNKAGTTAQTALNTLQDIKTATA
jgi:muramidase (phage lysozyme)